jgi:hypothetical protein
LDAPAGLLRKAIEIWPSRNENHRKIEPEFKPRNLLFIHALHKLGITKDFKPSSLQTNFEIGRRLFKESDKNN